MSQALGSAQWTTLPVPSDVSGQCRYIHVVSTYGTLRILVVPGRIDAAAKAVDVIATELRLRKARADYAAKH